MFGDDYYVDENFGFAIKIPNGGYVDTEAITVDEGRALVGFDFGGDGNFYSGFVIHFSQGDPDLIYYDDLLYYYSEYPQSAGGEYTQQIKITNEEVEQQGDRYKIIYEFTTKEYYPNDYFNSVVAGKTLTDGNKIVVFLYPNGEEYVLMMSSSVSTYSNDVKIFDSSVDTFYVGNVKKIPSNTDNSYPAAPEGGGCLIATATYGSEMALEVQQLRELRDNTLLQTESGASFMGTFNDVYYSFSPYIADYERENPVFKEVVKLAITPMISSLSILNYVDMNSESEVLGYGISLIILNGMMYLGIPAFTIIVIRKRF
jgi:hypothetical protein